MMCVHLDRRRSVSHIATEDEFRNATERDRANNCHDANPFPPGWSKGQKSEPIAQGSESAKDEKRPREEAMNATAAASVDRHTTPMNASDVVHKTVFRAAGVQKPSANANHGTHQRRHAPGPLHNRSRSGPHELASADCMA